MLVLDMRIKIRPEDSLFSNYIRSRANWKCERCLRQYTPPTIGLQNSHFHGRRKESVRFDPENCAALCFGCHRIMTEHPLIHVEWFKKRLGEKAFNALTLRANKTGKPDIEMVKLFCRTEIKNMGYGHLIS